MIDERARRQFEESGYHKIEGLLDPDEVHHYRMCINRAFDLPERELNNCDISTETYGLADGVSNTPEFWPLIFNQQLVETVRALLGEKVRYTQHSDLHINLGAGKFHRDSAHRMYGVGPDWDESREPYRVVRIAIYLSDHTDSGSSLLVLPGTHRDQSWLNEKEVIFWNKLRTWWRNHFNTNLMPQWSVTMKKTVEKHKAGDCFILDQRILHAGGVIRGPRPKYAAYLSYGVENQHSYNHRAFYRARPTYTHSMAPELVAKLQEADLLLAPEIDDSSV